MTLLYGSCIHRIPDSPPDPQARQRWPVERTNAWLKAKRRIATRRDRKADNYLAFLQLGMLLILAGHFEISSRHRFGVRDPCRAGRRVRRASRREPRARRRGGADAAPPARGA